MQLKDKLRKCFKEGEKIKERHKGMRQVDVNKEAIDNHLRKAEHNLKAIRAFKNIGYSDWSASASFYALYHCLLALILKFGVQSRNQSCTFAFIEDLINKKKISLETDDIKEMYDKEIEDDLAHSDRILDIREFMQYSFTTSLDDEKFNRLVERTEYLFNKIKKEVEKG